MKERLAYTFTVLRYVHDVVAGEFLNVGVVMHVTEEDRLLVRTQRRIHRLRKTFPDIDLHVYGAMMESIERGFSILNEELAGTPLVRSDRDALGHAQQLLPDDESCLQWSPTGWGAAEDVNEKLDRLFRRFVDRHNGLTAPPTNQRTDDDIRRQFLTKLSDLGATIPFEQKQVCGSQDEITFGTAWKNGSWHAYEPVSLDLKTERRIKNKARRWRGHLSAVREGATDEVRLFFLVDGPRNDSLAGAYESAKVILGGSAFEPEVVDEEGVDAFAEKVSAEYQKFATANQCL